MKAKQTDQTVAKRAGFGGQLGIQIQSVMFHRGHFLHECLLVAISFAKDPATLSCRGVLRQNQGEASKQPQNAVFSVEFILAHPAGLEPATF
jgi:hypothetical protein